MGCMNVVALAGNLVRDPELKQSPHGTAVAKFSLALNVGRDEVVYVDVTAFGRVAETTNEFCRKGALIGVTGRMTQERWETKDGQKRSKLAVIAGSVQFLNLRDGEHDQRKEHDQTPRYRAEDENQDPPPDRRETDNDDSELPF